jgi:hypothetical protein
MRIFAINSSRRWRTWRRVLYHSVPFIKNFLQLLRVFVRRIRKIRTFRKIHSILRDPAAPICKRITVIPKSNKSDTRKMIVCATIWIPTDRSTGDAASPLRTGWVMRWRLPTDRTRVAQVFSQRVTIWKSICLFFLSRDVNHFERDESRMMLMDGMQVVCIVCVN